MGSAQTVLVDLMKGRRTLGATLGLTDDDVERVVQIARGHLAAGRVRDAQTLLDGLCALLPNVAALQQLRGLARERTREWQIAIEAYSAAVRLLDDAADDRRALAYAARGMARLRAGDAAGALIDLALARPHLGDEAGPLAADVERFIGRCAETLEANASAGGA